MLWFSDAVGNRMRQWSADGKVLEILNPGGADHPDYARTGSFIGPNGMVTGKNGAVLLCQQGNRRIVQIGPDHKITALLDRRDTHPPEALAYYREDALFKRLHRTSVRRILRWRRAPREV